jgi:hypothetical protein
MKHVTYAEKSMLMGTEAADVLMQYAAAIARAHSADTVDLNAIGTDGNSVQATFLLGEGAPLMAETASTDVEEPDNADSVDYMKSRLRLLSSPPTVMAIDPSEFDPNDFEDIQRLDGAG